MFLILLAASLGLGPPFASAQDLPEVRLMAKWPAGTNLSQRGFGQNTAMTDKWIAATSPFRDLPAPENYVGAVHVFSAATGAWVRMLQAPPALVPADGFANAVAISGDFCLVGASEVGNIGAVYVYNLNTGAIVRTLQPSDGAANWEFGTCLQAHSGRVIVGAPGANSDQGRAYVFDIATGAEIRAFSAVTPVNGEKFGERVALDGNVALIGILRRAAFRGGAEAWDVRDGFNLAVITPTGAVANDFAGESLALSQGIAILGASGHNGGRGALFKYDLRSGQQQKIEATDGAASDGLGKGESCLSVVGELLCAGAQSAPGGFDTGRVYLFDLHSGAQLRKIVPRHAQVIIRFGCSVSAWGNHLIVGCSDFREGTPAAVGALYYYKNLSQPLPVDIIAAKGDTAPGLLDDSNFNTFGDAFLNAQGELAFRATLKGVGSHGNTDSGVWETLINGFNSYSRSNSSYQVSGTATILSVGVPVINQAATTVYPVTYKTGLGGITSLNNTAIHAGSGNSALKIVQTGDAPAVFGTAKLNSFGELVQSANGAHDRFAVFCNLRKETATSTNAANDSSILVQDMSAATDGRREGSAYTPDNTVNLGQFTGRIAFQSEDIVYSTALTGPVAANAAIVRKPFGLPEVQIARKAGSAPITGGTFSALLGECVDDNQVTTYRATITGGGSTAANNEALWSRDNVNVDKLILRKGQIAGLPAKLARIINFWPVSTGSGGVLALIQLTGMDQSGKPVNSTNDQMLVFFDHGTSLIVPLMREGQPAQGCHPASIGTINRVEADPAGGTYAVLCTLAGAPADSNQALFTGQCTNGLLPDKVTLRQPELFLRKGTLSYNQPSKIKSMSLPLGNLTASGAGGTGRGRAIASVGLIAVTVEFENGVRQIMTNTF